MIMTRRELFKRVMSISAVVTIAPTLIPVAPVVPQRLMTLSLGEFPLDDYWVFSGYDPSVALVSRGEMTVEGVWI